MAIGRIGSVGNLGHTGRYRCFVCGKEFNYDPIPVNDQMCCSSECLVQYHKEAAVKPEYLCRHCGKPFTTPPIMVGKFTLCSEFCVIKVMQQERDAWRGVALFLADAHAETAREAGLKRDWSDKDKERFSRLAVEASELLEEPVDPKLKPFLEPNAQRKIADRCMSSAIEARKAMDRKEKAAPPSLLKKLKGLFDRKRGN